MNRFLFRALGSLVAVTALSMASSAVAKRSVHYSGTALFHSYSTLGFPIDGLVDSTASVTGSFYYDDAFELIGASTRVDGILRGHFTCPVSVGLCQSLQYDGLAIGSAVGTTPEDGMEFGVAAPAGFGIDLLGPGRVVYDVQPGDYSTGFITWAAYDGALGFAYSVGDGTVTRVESAVPEPASWLLMIGGFGLVGAMARRGRRIGA
jgi:hypothetical protein